jgi:hypothetical protein
MASSQIVPRLVDAAQAPEDLAEVRGDLRVPLQRPGALDVRQAILGATQLEQHPAHAVENRRILGLEVQRPADQG